MRVLNMGAHPVCAATEPFLRAPTRDARAAQEVMAVSS
jgi:hypothetical protein